MAHDGLAAMTVIGGKITTYRLLAEAVLQELYPKSKAWTQVAPLPGGDIPRFAGQTAQEDFETWLAALKARFFDYDPAIIARMARLYGSETEGLLENGLGENLGGIFQAEIDHMVRNEWATTAEDVLWRRSKLGLHLDAAAQDRVAKEMAGIWALG